MAKPTKLVMETGAGVLRQLRAHPDGLGVAVLARRAVPEREVSRPTVHKALHWLRDHHDAPLEYAAGPKTWRLTDRSFSLPLLDPTPDDLVAAVFAGALLGPLGDPDLNLRIQRLIEEMDERLRESTTPPPASLRPGAVTATTSSSTPVDPRTLAVVVRATNRHVVRMTYYTPWADEHRTYTIEPWQLRAHDGSLYVRAHSRAARQPRTFRVAQIETARILPNTTPQAPIPKPTDLWGPGGLEAGIDVDRPDTATIRVRGPMARWLARTRWHPDQKDTWLEPNELLERTLPYNSCRELARRLLALGDAVTVIGPDDLRSEVCHHATALAGVLQATDHQK